MKAVKFGQIFIVAFLFFPVKAQVFVPQNMVSNPVLQRALENRNMTTTAISGLIRSEMLRNSAKGSKGKSSVQTRQLVATGPTSFKTLAANSIVKTIAGQMGKTPAEQKEAEVFFNACLERFYQVVKKDGFPNNDLASGFLFYVLNNYSVYHHVFENALNPSADVTKHPHYIKMPSEIGIYQQFRRLLSASDDIKKSTDKDKQQFTEILVIMTRTTFQLYEAGIRSGDNEMIQKARQMAKENLENLFQTSPDNLVINGDGVSLRN